jgi:hypothetical protein
MTSQGHFKDTLKDRFKKEKSYDEEYKSFTMEKTTQKTFLKANAPLPTIKAFQCSLPFFGGAFQCSVHPFGGALGFFKEILGGFFHGKIFVLFIK